MNTIQTQTTAYETAAAYETTPDRGCTFGEIFDIVRSFAPILTTIGWILGFTVGHIAAFEIISLILIAVGTISALLCCPLRLLAFPFKCIAIGFTFCRGLIPVYGVADLCAAIFGTIGGFTVGLAVSLGCPAIFTIKKYFEE